MPSEIKGSSNFDSDNVHTELVHLHAYCSTSFVLPMSGSVSAPFNAVHTNSSGTAWDSTANKFTVQTAGLYSLGMTVRMDSTLTTSPHVDIRFWINGGAKYDNRYSNIYDMRALDLSPAYWSWQKTMMVHLVVGDTIEFYAYCNSTTPNLKSDSSHWMITLVRGD